MRRVLVANRGEIACRIIRTLTRLGIESVAVHTDVDRDSLHCEMATVAVSLGPASDGGYRSAERLVAVAAEHGADGVHPGYGFLAEDAGFAAAVEDAALLFIGPTPEQIRRFGAKDEARSAAAAAGLPLLPGSGSCTNVGEAVAAARAVGFPLLVKSVPGGGGIGMLACHDPSDLPDVARRAMEHGEQAFGSRAVFLERLVTRARHVEVQVFGDGLGTVVVLGERDCSTQRRRQKVIEEAPAPELSADLRADLAHAARGLLEAEKYRSAGTVEFVIDVERGGFAFLEVNTRLQVEHTVTEAVTGIDLVEWMVRAAAGDMSFLDAPRTVTRGHAIEARIYAENPAEGFVPSPGVLTEVAWPSDVRVDTWARTGNEVSPYYDPLLAKLVVHAPTRDLAVEALGRALGRTVVRGIETNVALLASFVDAPVFRNGAVTTSTLEVHAHPRRVADVLVAGATTVQDFPGRLGLWHVGVPPSGPMDARSFRLGNRIVGNAEGAPGLECTATGPTLRFACDVLVCVAGASVDASCEGEPVPSWAPVTVRAGQTLTVGTRRGAGLRTYVLVRGGIDTGEVLGSASTFTLGGFGGHGGRELRTGDVLHLGDPAAAPDDPMVSIDRALVPVIGTDWDLAVTDGPHGAPDFVTEAGIATLYGAEWRVHHHSSRTGVRLVGPRIEWARADGGEAGLHPSNVHDTPYTLGAVDFTGDMPIVLGPDGPSLGGFTCPVTVIADDRWKLGQLAPGDRVRFVPVDLDEARARADATDAGLRARRARPRTGIHRTGPASTVLATRPALGDAPQVTYRVQGDRALLVEYGPMVLDFDLRLRAHALATWIEEHAAREVVELTAGIRSLQVQFDATAHSPASMLALLERAEWELPPLDDVVVPSRVVHLPLSWDDPSTRDAIDRYMRVVRDDAPWCPWNIEFIRRINGLASVDDVRRLVFDAEYLVLGLGDVYLGAPVAVPVDPRQRMVTTKYNPARTWTPENAVGIGGAYLCIYGMEGPGGYQFIGRTVPVWSRYGRGPHVSAQKPWLLRPFDRIRWFPVSADELAEQRAAAGAGRLALRIEDGFFARAEHQRFLARHHDSIATFRSAREHAFAAERRHWEALGEFDRADHGAGDLAEPADAVVGELPEGAFVVEAPLHGSVVRLLVGAGDRVAPGDGVATVEAMKTETTVVSPVGGTVHRLVCAEGAMVAAGTPIVVVVVDG